MIELEKVRQSAVALNIKVLQTDIEDYIHMAQIDKPSYIEFLNKIFENEISLRQQKKMESLLKKGSITS